MLLLSRDLRIVSKLAKLCSNHTVDLRCKHVAALCDKNKIVSLGVNKALSDPGFRKLSGTSRKSYVHAEWDCLNNTPADLSKHTIYVVRVDRNGRWAMSKPCEHCQAALRTKNIKRVVYTVNNGVALL